MGGGSGPAVPMLTSTCLSKVKDYTGSCAEVVDLKKEKSTATRGPRMKSTDVRAVLGVLKEISAGSLNHTALVNCQMNFDFNLTK